MSQLCKRNCTEINTNYCGTMKRKKKKMWQNKQNVKKTKMFYTKLRNSERSLSESIFYTLVKLLRQEG